jgi:hypothetical protein
MGMSLESVISVGNTVEVRGCIPVASGTAENQPEIDPRLSPNMAIRKP